MDNYKKALRILKEMGIYTTYVHHFTLQFKCGKTGLKNFLKDKSDYTVSRLLDLTLVWARTKEGRAFWSGKNKEFQNIFLTQSTVESIHSIIIEK